MRRTKAERAARKAKHKARKVVEAAQVLEPKAVALIDQLTNEVTQLREIQERFRGHIFGAFLARALGDEEKFSDAVLKAFPEWFKGYEEAPWMALSQR